MFPTYSTSLPGCLKLSGSETEVVIDSLKPARLFSVPCTGQLAAPARTSGTTIHYVLQLIPQVTSIHEVLAVEMVLWALFQYVLSTQPPPSTSTVITLNQATTMCSSQDYEEAFEATHLVYLLHRRAPVTLRHHFFPLNLLPV